MKKLFIVILAGIVLYSFSQIRYEVYAAETHLDISYNRKDLSFTLRDMPTENNSSYDDGLLDSNRSKVVQKRDSCSEYCLSCGDGREDGYNSTYATSGCRNWEGWSYKNYGALDIPYWINMSSMNTISNEEHRNILINDIRYQASIWNEAIMYDGSGRIVNLYEVGIGEDKLPSKINGKKVVEIAREDGDYYSGQFDPDELKIRLTYTNSSTNKRPGRFIDTPMHEMGHLLGLYDLDNGMVYGTHKALMGYYRSTQESTVYDAITYHDIQGIAVTNGKHTTHQFSKYFIRNGQYLHVCFYCDTIDSRSYALEGSSHLSESANCSHDFQPMVGLNNKLWLKCVHCYKIQTHYHSYTYSYEYYNSNYHKSSCSCGNYLLEEHFWSPRLLKSVYKLDNNSTNSVIIGPISFTCHYCGASKIS